MFYFLVLMTWGNSVKFRSAFTQTNCFVHYQVFRFIVEESESVIDICIFTARKRSLGQGNIFTSVCREFCSQGGCLVWGGRCLLLGGLVPGGVSSLGGTCSWGAPGGDPPDSYCCGRYVSYWNAFLFAFLC